MTAHRREHQIFIATIVAKGLLGLVQFATAVALALGVVDRLPSILRSFVAHELTEDPNDFLAGKIMTLVARLPDTHTAFYTIYFTAHGLLHVAVVAALLFSAAWAYPFTILVLVVFVVYQVIEWMSVGGTMLVLLTALDLFVIYLTVQEWRNRPGQG